MRSRFGAEQQAAGGSTQTSIGRFGVLAWKELLQIRRQPEFAAQVLATPIGIGFMMYIAGYKSLMELATKGGANISMAILIGCSYMLMIAATQMLAASSKHCGCCSANHDRSPT